MAAALLAASGAHADYDVPPHGLEKFADFMLKTWKNTFFPDADQRDGD